PSNDPIGRGAGAWRGAWAWGRSSRSSGGWGRGGGPGERGGRWGGGLRSGVLAPAGARGPRGAVARGGGGNKVFHLWSAVILLGLVGLAAPAATAGAICQDKARGSLALLFATDLSDAEIVLGKLAARLVQVLGMILGVAPVLAVATLFGGVAPV